MQRIIKWCISHHRTTTAVMLALTVVLGLLAAVPSIWPESFPRLHGVVVDTDPENMLPVEEPARVFNAAMKEEFTLYDMLVVGIVNDRAPDYVFNPATLRDIFELTEYAKTLRGAAIGKPDTPDEGVVAIDIIAPSTVDNVEQGGLGTVSFEWLMPEPPATDEAARAVRDKAMNLPFMKGTLISEDGQAVALYLPLTDKHLSFAVASKLREKIATFTNGDDYHITGLPVAEDTFGVEMFKQMAISAPLAMVVIFLLLWYFFKKLTLIIPPMILAAISCAITMSLLIATGNTIHIMSSMIPIFIMPIAVLDSIHILSRFFDRYQSVKDRSRTIEGVMESLFTPMLYTSLTTAVGFASLALTPIPPVQVFGIYVAIGVMVAWVFTMTFIPASVMFIKESSLENFGLTDDNQEAESHSLMTRILRATGQGTYTYAKLIIGISVLFIVLAVVGITKVVINDNPVLWFEPKHEIRVADRVMNSHFGGTYMGYLALAPEGELARPPHLAEALAGPLADEAAAMKAAGMPGADAVVAELAARIAELNGAADTREEFFAQLSAFAEGRADAAADDVYETWEAAALFVSAQAQAGEVFKEPEVLNWMVGLQDHLQTIESPDGRQLVGKSNSLADLVRTVYRELMEGKEEFYRIPESKEGVAQTVLQYESSHRPQDLAHFVRTDTWRNTSIWIQQKSGDNRDMNVIVDEVGKYVAANPAPAGISAEWFGLTYINVIWQAKMVSGMMLAFLGSFAAVWLMMIILYRSALWGLLAMIPLTVTIGAIYGMIGFIGKDYDMPVAVLSALSLGMAVDYAVHFLSRSRLLQTRYGSWEKAAAPMFEEPARAITRNVIVVGVGFLPLLAAPLVPYQTVGIFVAAILLTAGVASLLMLPAMITLLDKWLFRDPNHPVLCNCCTIFFVMLAACITIALNIQASLGVSWNRISLISGVLIIAATAICFFTRKRDECRIPREPAAKALEKEGDEG